MRYGVRKSHLLAEHGFILSNNEMARFTGHFQ